MAIRAIIMSAIVVASLPVCVWRPMYGICLWYIMAFLRPESYIWAGAGLPWALAIAVATIAGMAISSRGWMRRLASRECLMLVLLWVWFTVTSIVSSDSAMFAHHAADTWSRWSMVSKTMLMTLVTVGVIDSYERWRKVIVVIAASFGAFVLKSLPFVLMTQGSMRLYGPERSMIADNNDFGLALDMTLPLFFFLARTESKPWLRRLYIFLFVVTIPAIFFTYSRGAMLGLVVVFALMVVYMRRLAIFVPVGIIAVIVAVLFAPQSWKDRMNPQGDVVDASALSRFNSWQYSWALASDFPVAGGGFDTFTPELFSQYAPNPRDVHGPHSVYFGVLAEHGFVGLGFYLLLVASCFLSTFQLVRRGKKLGNRLTVEYANMCRFSLIGFLVPGAFLGRAYFDYYFAIVAFIAALKMVTKFGSEDEDEETDPLAIEGQAA